MSAPFVVEPLPCPDCGRAVKVDCTMGDYQVACGNCFDADWNGNGYVPLGLFACDYWSAERCVESWNEQVEERMAELEEEVA